jgi:aspartate/methionine/tyrosine aminotransferase
MNQKVHNTLDYFKLKPSRAAKVSEISEAAAVSTIPQEERVNFHIGNPVQDERLVKLFFRNILGLKSDLNYSDFNSVLDELNIERDKKHYIEFLYQTIKNSIPYLPRGGFTPNKPSELILYFHNWLKVQEESFEYDLGTKSGKRECSIISGGIWEAIRVFLQAVSSYMIIQPVNILLYNIDLPEHLKNFPSIKFTFLPSNEAEAQKIIERSVNNTPHFLFLGSVLNEETRRNLRRISLEKPLFFVELNDAPNHLSIAREAKMLNRVIRFISPAVFSKNLNQLSIIFACGNSDFIKIIDTIHFQIKGTPSSSETELLSYLLKNEIHLNGKNELPTDRLNLPDEINLSSSPVKHLPVFSNTIAEKYSGFYNNKLHLVESTLDRLLNKANESINSFFSGSEYYKFSYDQLYDVPFDELSDFFLSNLKSPELNKTLSESFLNSFICHHPEYKKEESLVVSGSARTALSLLGFHCGINEVIIPDFSWTYEHCFPKVDAIPLTENLELDSEAIIKRVKLKLDKDPAWNKYGAVVLNNPHNASGQIFDEEEIIFLLKWLLRRKIFVIDDLSYQNVAPAENLNGPKTIKQIVCELVNNGYIGNDESKYLIVIHSLSKTDCFAGARLSVANIPHLIIRQELSKKISSLKPNIMAIFIAYLFYRNDAEKINQFWLLRNIILKEKMDALNEAQKNLPDNRNQFGIRLKRPAGSMYPHLIIENLPSGLSLDWLALGLASQGIGLIPLSTFARTSEGYELARKTFRLTLGGTDNAEILSRKMRRVFIDINQLIAEEAAKYTRKTFNTIPSTRSKNIFGEAESLWQISAGKVINRSVEIFSKRIKKLLPLLDSASHEDRFEKEFIPERINIFKNKFLEELALKNEIVFKAQSDNGSWISSLLEKELYKEDLAARKFKFRKRLYDRTVHPTQMFSIKVDEAFNVISDSVIKNIIPDEKVISKAAETLIDEFLGVNVPIKSVDEADEILLDLNTIINAEDFVNLNTDYSLSSFLSFWGDWDGSTRPSGQGHRLVSTVVVENVNKLALILKTLLKTDKSVSIDQNLLIEIDNLHIRNEKFWSLQNDITSLTNQLEKRYKSILPFNIRASRLRAIGIKMHLARDPIISLYQHNDRLEKRMRELRNQRKQRLEYYFSLNKRLRKTLFSLIHRVKSNYNNPELMLEAGSYRNLLNRFVLNPRIHQNMLTAKDQFPIDTTVHNIMEINEISGRYGNPGMILSIQVSMSTEPEALISLDRKLNARKEKSLRDNPGQELPSIWITPLFEDSDALNKMENYLGRLWEYAIASRSLDQEPKQKFEDMVCELFIAGSDLSQQVSQPAGAELYKEAKYKIILWLADRGLVENIRIKMGSGEPMQRQGGYYAPESGKHAFIFSEDNDERLKAYLKASTKKSTEYAVSPLRGVLSEGVLRTFQSNISEKLRYINLRERAQLLFQIQKNQNYYRNELVKAAEPLLDTRLQFTKRGLQQLERLTIEKKDELYAKFVELVTQNFRQILYGKEEDVVGIHTISYFVSRTIPNLRDRPVVRPSKSAGERQGTRILEQIAEIIPQSKHGTLLRAIGHNQAQTMVLGINQLTTGLFRSLSQFSKQQFNETDAASIISERILTRLPVYEILHTLRIFHDPKLTYLSTMEKAFPAGNSCFLILREDIDSIQTFIGLIKKELLRRHGISVTEFFDEDKFIPDLLPALRPDLAVLFQPSLFNTDFDLLMSSINGDVNKTWAEKVKNLLKMPEEISGFRKKIWELIEEPIYQQVESFVELSMALYVLFANMKTDESQITPLFTPGKLKIGSSLLNLLQSSGDDSMKNFLVASVQYLSRLPENLVEVPIDIIRAMKDVEKILRIEEQVLSPREQDMLRFYILQIARIAGENG